VAHGNGSDAERQIAEHRSALNEALGKGVRRAPVAAPAARVGVQVAPEIRHVQSTEGPSATPLA